MAQDSLGTFVLIHNVLTKAASETHTVAYSDAMSQVGWDYKNTYQRNVFAYYLKAVFYLELSGGNPPLTAIVVSKTHGLPQKSFFDVSRQEQRLRKDETDKEYWERVIVKVYDAWAKPSQKTAA